MKFALTSLLATLLGGCAGAPPPAAPPPPPRGAAAPVVGLPHYRCEHDIEFTVQFADDTALLDAGPRGRETLLRDAGGLTPQQTVYSNPRLRAEFGLGAGGREAILRYPEPPLVVQCRRQ